MLKLKWPLLFKLQSVSAEWRPPGGDQRPKDSSTEDHLHTKNMQVLTHNCAICIGEKKSEKVNVFLIFLSLQGLRWWAGSCVPMPLSHFLLRVSSFLLQDQLVCP